ncbi:Charged multivesicular body 7-like protein [Cladobotryum mycophilum]|uniref:Charged multivesicular body 7-like protein n=1 Tax=Cladobotryum mycophilum TaxID=491253 RepID=A0ABR0T0Z6_9HYPO
MGELADYLVKNDTNFRKTRLPALYADFRSQKTLNPDGYEANITAWSQALSRLASDGLLSRQGSNSSLLILDLDESLRRSLDNGQYGQPQALGAVIHDAMAKKDFIPLQGFLQSQHNIYQQTWSEVPWNVMGWALRQIGVADPTRGDDKIPTGRYVVMKNVEMASTELSNKVADKTSRFDRVFTKSQFQVIFSSALVSKQRLSEADLNVLLKFLSRDKGIIEYDGQTIRIRGSGEQGGITEEDASIASIKELTTNLEHQVDLLNRRIDELDREARTAVLRKNRITALAALKGKKLAESSLARRYTTLNQLEEVASKLQQASDQIQLVKVMESSAGALKNLNAQIGSAERVDAVMDRLREQMSETDEVAAILAESTGVVVDEAEIDDELKEMEREQKEKEVEAERKEEEAHKLTEAQKQLDELPAVPTDIIPERTQVQTPTTETGIGKLTIDG